jgi:hypothetical protein
MVYFLGKDPEVIKKLKKLEFEGEYGQKVHVKGRALSSDVDLGPAKLLLVDEIYKD